ncbi:MAG: MASE4 domain-containing protein [Acetobacteraceae bacterium]
MHVRNRLLEPQLFLATLPADERARRIVRLAALISVCVFAATLPFVQVKLPEVWAFIPSYQAIVVTNDLVTAVLLFAQFASIGLYRLLALAAAYLFSALIAAVHMLTFPGAFAPEGLLGAGPQTTAWLYAFWHGGFPLLIIVYALLRDAPAAGHLHRPARLLIPVTLLVVAGVVAAMTVTATLGHSYLPPIMQKNVYAPAASIVLSAVWALSLVALVVLWRRRPHTVLDLWLMVVMWAWLCDIALGAVLNGGRFDLGFYAGRIYGLMAATFVLIMLLVQTGALYARVIRLSEQNRRHAEHAASTLREGIDTIPAGFVIFDEDDRLVMCNQSYRDFYPEAADRMQPGARFEDILRDGVRKGRFPDASGFEEEWIADRLRRHREPQSTSEQQLKDGRWVLVTENRLPSGYIAGLRVDITSLKAAERALHDREEQLRQTQRVIRANEMEQRERTLQLREAQVVRDAAVSANQTKSRFLAIASHDLRQPLHAINLFTSGLRRRVADDEAGRLVDGIATAAESMQAMFNALLDVAKLEAGAITPSIADVELEQVFVRLRASFAGPAAAKGLTLEIPYAPHSVSSDPALLESVLQNLLSNAVRYTAAGTIVISCDAKDQAVVIRVEDTGIGIPAEELERIFDEFHRLGPPGPTDRGLGLGLAIARRLTGLLKIDLAVSSRVGLGSVFSLRMPLARQAETTVGPRDQEAGAFDGVRLLLVDDDPLALEALAREVLDWGAEPIAAGSADAALSVVAKFRERPFDFVIVDRELGSRINGPMLLAIIREQLGHTVPGVIVTGATDRVAIEELRRSGHWWVTKPVDPDALRRTVSTMLAGLRVPL